MIAGRQTTVRNTVALSGYGVHSAAVANIAIRPASPNHGIVFLRTGLEGGIERRIPARYGNVSMTELCTVLGNPSHGAVSTVEHIMAALYGLGIDNALIEIDGPEVPIMDGSAAAFVEALRAVGVESQRSPKRYVRVLKPVSVSNKVGTSELLPHDDDVLRLDVTIAFDTAVIGDQTMTLDLEPEAFAAEVSRARTFGFMRDVEQLWKNGFALGASLENTVAIGDDRVINPEGLRFDDEFVRHKMLDAVGDLALAGLPIVGLFRSRCGGHRLNISVLRELFSDPANFAICEAETAVPARHVQMAAAAYAPALG
ncbi:MAG: UDP-3-O-acyl-N-acetylglucosamine deacetylase [Hyphomicrobiales bacterium]|jgi:UDP-3-O-[3-hydroxymyristoyl] N-acetylglucosamine deacetylase|nr:UDP-3-O-acyl-N-acetylglucosamine deacetylase [Hyphomicrobiales bacterium]